MNDRPGESPKVVQRFIPHALWEGVNKTINSDLFGGFLIGLAALVSVILANTGGALWYTTLRDTVIAVPFLDLNLTVGQWAADGLLAVFFFVVGLELKEEFVVGSLRDPRKAVVPIGAAFGGVITPAIIFTIVNTISSRGALEGWAIPTATDIAFAAAVLALVGRSLPGSIRIFLLTLAIADDLIAIVIIAVIYTQNLQLLWLLALIVPLVAFTLLVRRGVRSWWVLVPLGLITWWMMHESGVHATIAGVLLGFSVPVRPIGRARVEVGMNDEGDLIYEGMAAHFADKWGKFATLVVVPIFAFFSAGVALGGDEGFFASLTHPIALGVFLGLLFGKPIGILGTTFIFSRVPKIGLDPTLKWPDLVGMSFVAGVGFTVSMLVGELAYGSNTPNDQLAKIGILTGSLVAGIVGTIIIRLRTAHMAKVKTTERLSSSHDSKPSHSQGQL